VTLVAWLVHSTDRAALAGAVLDIDLWNALLAVTLLFMLIAIQTWRWTFVAHAIGISFPFIPAWLINQIGAFFNQVLPSSIGGDAMRVWRLRGGGVRTGPAVASIVLDRVVALVGTTLIVIFGMWWTWDWIEAIALRVGLAAIVLVVVAGVTVLLIADQVPLVRRFTSRLGLGRLLQLPVMARRVLLSRATMAPALALSVIIHLGVALSVWLLADGIGVKLSWAEAGLLVPVVILFSMVPITIAGWGVREGAMVVALGTVGVVSQDALAISVLFGIASAIAALPGGVIWLATGRTSAARNRRAGDDLADKRAARHVPV
jgi:uncharacterized protein (TIRG00374 family)